LCKRPCLGKNSGSCHRTSPVLPPPSTRPFLLELTSTKCKNAVPKMKTPTTATIPDPVFECPVYVRAGPTGHGLAGRSAKIKGLCPFRDDRMRAKLSSLTNQDSVFLCPGRIRLTEARARLLAEGHQRWAPPRPAARRSTIGEQGLLAGASPPPPSRDKDQAGFSATERRRARKSREESQPWGGLRLGAVAQ